MKKLYVLSFLLLNFIVNAQIVNIPDANFKAKLLEADVTNSLAKDSNDNNIKIDVNSNGEIEVSEALLVYRLFYVAPPPSLVESSDYYYSTSSYDISDLTGIEYFTNLQYLNVSGNLLSSIDISALSNLINFNCSNNTITSFNSGTLSNLEIINISNNSLSSFDPQLFPNIERVLCSDNLFSSLNFSDLTELFIVNCSNNPITDVIFSNNDQLYSVVCDNTNVANLDFSNTSLYALSCLSNPNLEFLNVKNGVISPDSYQQNPLVPIMTDTFQLDNIGYICHDEDEFGNSLVISQNLTNVSIGTYCSFTPGGTFYEVSGNTKYDFDTNGCDVSDINYPNLNFNITDGTTTDSFISNVSGNFDIPLQAGNYIITPNLENPSYFNSIPSSFTVNFPTQPSPFTQDFCVTANGVHSDVEVMIVPRNPARPGFDANYKIVFRNKGNQVENGNVTLAFDDAVLDYVSSNPIYDSVVTNSLIWNYTNLQPFETREIEITFNVNFPTETPAVNNGDVLNYTATITTANTDETIEDNSFTLNQTVIGSYDPNDKTCLEGEFVEPSMIGKYVHYVIRFENTGTYPAQNIVVKDMIDASKFDLSSLIPLHSSHDFYTRIKDNKVEFIFENINLDFNGATNNGYVAFKIKTLPSLIVGETFSNEANIYFDYNFPITTNNYVTTIQALSNSSFDFEKEFVLYPNPVKDILNISGKNQTEIESVEIYNIIGQLVIAVSNSTGKIDVSNLENGTYFIKVNSEKGSGNTKFIKE